MLVLLSAAAGAGIVPPYLLPAGFDRQFGRLSRVLSSPARYWSGYLFGRLATNTDMEDHARYILLNSVQQHLELREAYLFVKVFRFHLLKSGEAGLLSLIFHFRKMLYPQFVNHSQHDQSL